jgi:hypothetical protein
VSMSMPCLYLSVSGAVAVSVSVSECKRVHKFGVCKLSEHEAC